ATDEIASEDRTASAVFLFNRSCSSRSDASGWPKTSRLSWEYAVVITALSRLLIEIEREPRKDSVKFGGCRRELPRDSNHDIARHDLTAARNSAAPRRHLG